VVGGFAHPSRHRKGVASNLPAQSE
jgi:hypothetical protein